MDCSLPESSVHGIFQDRILERITIPFSRGSSQPRDWTQVSHITGEFFTDWATMEAILFYFILFYFGLQDLSYLIRDWTQGPRNESLSPKHWTTREFNSLTLTIHHKNLEKKYKVGNSSSKSFHIDAHILLLFSHHSYLHELRCPHPPVNPLYPYWLYKPGLVEETVVIPFNSVEAY